MGPGSWGGHIKLKFDCYVEHTSFKNIEFDAIRVATGRYEVIVAGYDAHDLQEAF